MKHIPADVLQTLKQRLLERRAKLSEVQKVVDEANPVHNEDRVNNNASPDTDAREEAQILESEVVGSEVVDMLARVNGALDRMEKGIYGLTHDGKEIPIQRLLVDPTATTLVQ
ncbi:MAG: hypothetical protein HZA34_00195 [Candidatus Pacebacteria bacterium]|nr:hypothetical protein [Candidatus Paceibacterota bacterium]